MVGFSAISGRISNGCGSAVNYQVIVMRKIKVCVSSWISFELFIATHNKPLGQWNEKEAPSRINSLIRTCSKHPREIVAKQSLWISLWRDKWSLFSLLCAQTAVQHYLGTLASTIFRGGYHNARHEERQSGRDSAWRCLWSNSHPFSGVNWKNDSYFVEMWAHWAELSFSPSLCAHCDMILLCVGDLSAAPLAWFEMNW